MMAFGMSDEHTSYQMRSVRDQVARSRGRSAVRQVTGRTASLRSRLGFTLVEAGLRLLPEGQHQHG